MYYTAQTSELETPLAVLHPVSQGIGVANSAWVLMENYHRAHLELIVGVMGAGGTVDCQIRQASDAAGTGAKVIADKAGTGNKAITQLTQAGGDGNDIVRIELQTEELDVDNGFEYIGVQLTVAGAACLLSYVLYGNEPRYPPIAATNFTEVID